MTNPAAAPRDHGIPAQAQALAQARDYGAYCLRIRSDFTLPELRPSMAAADAPPDLSFVRAAPGPREMAEGVRFHLGEARLSWPEVGSFLVSDGLVTVRPREGVSDDLVAFPLLGPVLAAVLHLRGRFVLHASAISVGGEVVVMMGAKGAGKSTTASALISAGHALVADDLVALDVGRNTRALPGFPQMKLDDAALARLDDPRAEVRPEVHPQIRKHRVIVERFAVEPLPVRRLYLLERGDGARVLPIAGVEALGGFMRFSYAARYGRTAFDGSRAAAHVRKAAAMADAGLAARLVVPDGLDRIPEIVPTIEADVARLAEWPA